ncbi:hypothetical protein [Sporomusa sphaeroides]|nr:hypothetical protein [Sporomusa sphaeroides]
MPVEIAPAPAILIRRYRNTAVPGQSVREQPYCVFQYSLLLPKLI